MWCISYIEPKNFKKFTIEQGNVVWGKNWDMIFPIEDLYSPAIIPNCINSPTDEDFEDTLKWIGPDLDPYYFGHRLTQARINDFQRTIGEARWGFYRE